MKKEKYMDGNLMRLINQSNLVFCQNYSDNDYLWKHLLILASDIEETFEAMGAKPNEDYTYLDLMKMAIELKKGILISKSIEDRE